MNCSDNYDGSNAIGNERSTVQSCLAAPFIILKLLSFVRTNFYERFLFFKGTTA